MMLEYDDGFRHSYSTRKYRYTEKEEQQAIDDGLANFKWSVELDGNLLHVRVNYYQPSQSYMGQGTNVTIIVPFMRGVSAIYPDYSRSHEQAGFNILMHGTEQLIPIGSGTVAYVDRPESEVRLQAGIKAKMALVRHDVLAAINEYHNRPYKGEQLELKL